MHFGYTELFVTAIEVDTDTKVDAKFQCLMTYPYISPVLQQYLLGVLDVVYYRMVHWHISRMFLGIFVLESSVGYFQTSLIGAALRTYSWCCKGQLSTIKNTNAFWIYRTLCNCHRSRHRYKGWCKVPMSDGVNISP
jgi:hypothetical protein